MSNPAHTTLTEMQSLGANPQDLAHNQVEQLRDYLTNDLFAFAWFVFEYHDLIDSLHGQIAGLIAHWGQPGYERIMVQIPREFFKTSLCTRSNALWQVVRDPNAPVAIFNERIENTAKWIRAIRDVAASNELFQIVFRDLMPPGVSRNDTRTMPRSWKWSDTELQFQRDKITPEASITGLGIGAASAGGHWPKIIKDDLISEDAAKSPTVMAAAIEWFDKSLYLERPALKGWDLIPCTPWTYSDLYSYILRTYNYKLYRRAALEGDPLTSIFPQKLSTKELIAQRERDPYGFSSMMMCRPRPGKDQAFELSWIRYGSITKTPDDEYFTIDPAHYSPDCREDTGSDTTPRQVPLHYMNKCLLFDPAPSEQSDRRREDKARNALVMQGVDPWGRRYVLDVWAGRENPTDVIEQVFTMLTEWGADHLAVEEVNFSMLYRHWIYTIAAQRKINLRVTKLKPERQQKDTRIVAKIPDMRRGLYYWNRATTEPLRQEYLEYPYGDTRDLLDAWGYDRKALNRWSTPNEVATRKLRDQLEGGNYSTPYF